MNFPPYTHAIILFCISFYVFLFLIFYLLITNKFEKLNQNKKYTHTVYDILDNGKTGDVVLVSYRKSCGLIKLFTNSKWTHTSMLYRNKKDQLFVIECGSYKSDEYSGVNLIPFELWFKLNKRSHLTWIPIKKKISNDKIKYIHSKYKKSSFNGAIRNMIYALKENKYNGNEKTNESFFCSQFIMTILQDLKLIPKEIKPISFSPNDFYKKQRYEHIESLYEKPINVKNKRSLDF